MAAPGPFRQPMRFTNQSPPFADVGPVSGLDRPAAGCGAGKWGRGGGQGALRPSDGVGVRAEMLDLGRRANENPPQAAGPFERAWRPPGLRRVSTRAYHLFMAESFCGAAPGPPPGGPTGVWRRAPAQVSPRGALSTWRRRSRPDISCPITMTRAAVAALGGGARPRRPSSCPRSRAREYDPVLRPLGRRRRASRSAWA